MQFAEEEKRQQEEVGVVMDRKEVLCSSQQAMLYHVVLYHAMPHLLTIILRNISHTYQQTF